MKHKHDWYVFIRQDLTAFRICMGCPEREECPLPDGYPHAVSWRDVPGYILPCDKGVQLSLW